MTTAEIESLRPGFEAWYAAQFPALRSNLAYRRAPGVHARYASNHCDGAFEAYCFAKSEPVEITEDIVERAAILMLAQEEDCEPSDVCITWNFSEITHCGDCTNMPIACPVCLADECRTRAKAILTAALSPAQDGGS